jgi:type 2 lantibiotic biosynthesis protein LanM
VAAAAPPQALPSLGTWQEAFGWSLRPFLAVARDRLAEGARRCLPEEHADLCLVGDTFTAVLEKQLAGLAVRTQARELDAARSAGLLTGDSPRRRLEDFLRRQCTPAGLAGLVEKYPVLGRLLGQASLMAAECALELLTRLAADRAAVVRALLSGPDPGPVVALEPGLGDRHLRGRSVTAVSFADGRKIVYKPRDVRSYVFFCEVAGWLGRLVPGGMRTARTVARDGYGWQEFIPGAPLARPSAARDFYRREGMLLAALYALHACDIHAENIIACGDQPVLVDAETLFHPTLPVPGRAGDPAAAALDDSVYRSAMLPAVTAGEYGLADRSGMGGDAGETCPDAVLDWDPPATDSFRLVWRPVLAQAAGNRPRCAGRAIEPADHEAALLEGFRLGYDAIAANPAKLAAITESHAGLQVRVVARSTSGYARLLAESSHPDLLGHARDRDKALDVLREVSAGQPFWTLLARHEAADLRNGDIPFLSSRPRSRDLWTSSGLRLRGLLGRPGLSSALRKIAAMGEADRCDQEWVISASLATRLPASAHRSTEPVGFQVSAAAAEPGRLLAAACGVADQIVACGKAGEHGGRVNWLGLQHVEGTRWMLLPMGADLANGYLGVALFLAQLASLTGVDRYAQEARRALSPLPRLWDALAGRGDLLAAVGCGAADGLGGICYGLARLATLLGDGELSGWAETAVGLASEAAALPAPPGWAAGLAGCLAAMSAVRAELGSAAAGSAARACADRLADLAERTNGRCCPDGAALPPGFADGPAGIGWALAGFAGSGNDPGCQAASHGAARCAQQQTGGTPGSGGDGWCSGTAGLLLTRGGPDGEAASAVRPAARLLSSRPLLRDLSLCHGETGIADVLTVLSAKPGGEAAAWAQRRRAGLILDAIDRHGSYCGTPGGISTPGLLCGLAGIGYGLLRLGFADRVPSVLLLEPTPPPARKPIPSPPLASV